MKTPWLKKIDLRKITKSKDIEFNGTIQDEYITHPDININCWYLVKLDKQYIAGQFTKEWYGLCFSDGWIDFSLDDIDIKGIWQIRTR